MAIREKKPRESGDGAGEIRLRQMAEMQIGEQNRTLEIALTLPAGSTDEELGEALRQMEIGMRGITTQLDQQIALLAGTVNGHVAISSAPAQRAVAPPATAIAPTMAAPSVGPETPTPDPARYAAEPIHQLSPQIAPATSATHTSTTPRESAIREVAPPTHAPAIGAAMPTPIATPSPLPPAAPSHPPPTANTTAVAVMTLAQFLKQANTLGFGNADEIPTLIGEKTLQSIDYGAALARLQHVATQRAASPATRTFAEEGGEREDEDADAYEAPAPIVPLATLDDLDEPDFTLGDEDGEGEELAAAPVNPQAAALRRRTAALERLRALRGLRGGGPAATAETTQSLKHLVIEPLTSAVARDLVIAIWHPPAGEKLNQVRTRALVEWAKSDDEMEQTAELMLQLANADLSAEE